MKNVDNVIHKPIGSLAIIHFFAKAIAILNVLEIGASEAKSNENIMTTPDGNVRRPPMNLSKETLKREIKSQSSNKKDRIVHRNYFSALSHAVHAAKWKSRGLLSLVFKLCLRLV